MIRLLESLKGAKAEVRFFVLLWFKCYGDESRVSMKVADIAVRLGVSKTVVSESLSYLTRNGFFDKDVQQNQSRTGRPTPLYHVSNRLLAILYDYQKSIVHQSLIDELLELHQYKDTHADLKLGNRLLLCVFLLYADQHGVVQDLGFATVSKLTGMSRDQFNSQMEKLVRLGYIRLITRGITSRHIFGSRPSIYLVDVTVGSFTCASFRTLTCDCGLSDDFEKTLMRVINDSCACLKSLEIVRRIDIGDDIKQQGFLDRFKYLKRKFEDDYRVDSSERCWRLFIELKRRPVLRVFLFEKILQIAVQKVFAREKQDQAWFAQVADEFSKELEPVFGKCWSIDKDLDSENTAIVGEEYSEDLESKLKYYLSQIDSWDLGVLSLVLVSCIISNLIKAIESKIGTIEEHFGMKFSFGYILEDKYVGANVVNAARSIVGLYSVANEQTVKRVYINRGVVHEISSISTGLE